MFSPFSRLAFERIAIQIIFFSVRRFEVVYATRFYPAFVTIQRSQGPFLNSSLFRNFLLIASKCVLFILRSIGVNLFFDLVGVVMVRKHSGSIGVVLLG